MSVEVMVPKDQVEAARAILDRHADHPPWVCTNVLLPDIILLKYDLPKGDGFDLYHQANVNGWKAKTIRN